MTSLAAGSSSEAVAYWIPATEQFCIASKSGRPFAKAWEPLYATPTAPAVAALESNLTVNAQADARGLERSRRAKNQADTGLECRKSVPTTVNPYDPDNETEGETNAYQAGYTRGWEDRQRREFATPTAPAVSEADQFDESIRAIHNGEVTLDDVAPAVAAEPSDEQIRAAFRDYDARTGSPTHNTAWQSWRDACKWLLALRQGTAAPASVPPGFVLVPTHPNAEMTRVMDAEDWQWEDVLAAAGTATEAEILAVPVSVPAVSEPSKRVLYADEPLSEQSYTPTDPKASTSGESGK